MGTSPLFNLGYASLVPRLRGRRECGRVCTALKSQVSGNARTCASTVYQAKFSPPTQPGNEAGGKHVVTPFVQTYHINFLGTDPNLRNSLVGCVVKLATNGQPWNECKYKLVDTIILHIEHLHFSNYSGSK